MSTSKKSKFRFVNYSNTYQLRLETAEDLAAIPLLDEPFWMATSAPTHQLHSDKKMLEFLDDDGDARSRDESDPRAGCFVRFHPVSGVGRGNHGATITAACRRW